MGQIKAMDFVLPWHVGQIKGEHARDQRHDQRTACRPACSEALQVFSGFKSSCSFGATTLLILKLDHCFLDDSSEFTNALAAVVAAQ